MSGYNLRQNYWDSFIFFWNSCTISILPSPRKEKVSPVLFPYSMLFCFIKPSCVILLLPEIILGKRIRENGHSFGNGFHLSHFYRKTYRFLLCASTGFVQGCSIRAVNSPRLQIFRIDREWMIDNVICAKNTHWPDCHEFAMFHIIA